MNRRDFITNISFATFLLADGTILEAKPTDILSKKTRLRFLVASDGHFGQPKTDFLKFYQTFVQQVNAQNKLQKFDLCVINGDIIHDQTDFLEQAKQQLDELDVPYHVTQGNHDHATPEYWERLWHVPQNYDVVLNDSVFLFGTTSNQEGKYLCPNNQWFSAKLEQYKRKKNVFIFVHITPVKWTDNGLDCQDFQALLRKYKNVRAVFNGHDHDQDNIKTQDGIPYLFSAHFGGSWGTNYRGFRVVELMKDNSILTYIMNPTEKINEKLIEKG